jgi:hypothetical protein
MGGCMPLVEIVVARHPCVHVSASIYAWSLCVLYRHQRRLPTTHLFPCRPKQFLPAQLQRLFLPLLLYHHHVVVGIVFLTWLTSAEDMQSQPLWLPTQSILQQLLGLLPQQLLLLVMRLGKRCLVVGMVVQLVGMVVIWAQLRPRRLRASLPQLRLQGSQQPQQPLPQATSLIQEAAIFLQSVVLHAGGATAAMLNALMCVQRPGRRHPLPALNVVFTPLHALMCKTKIGFDRGSYSSVFFFFLLCI